jgi:histone deacetylase 4/5
LGASTGLVYDERFQLHRAPYEHPEHPGRLTAIRDHLDRQGLLDRCQHVEAREATPQELAAIHEASYIAMVESTGRSEFAQLDPDTYTCRDSARAALLAAGGLVELTLSVLAGRLDSGFALLRPPGHHAEADRAMGFCLFNNVAIAAAAARRSGARRVLIVDWDLHHGNGTQHSFWDDPDVLYFSTHQYPFYPGTGAVDEVGGPRARGRTVNVPWPAGCGDAEFLEAFDSLLLPIAGDFGPDVVLVSAGFDAAAGDPLGSLRVSPDGYSAMTSRLTRLASGKLVLALEGGYNLSAISRSAEACLRILLGETASAAAMPPIAPMARKVLDAVRRQQQAFWPVL